MAVQSTGIASNLAAQHFYHLMMESQHSHSKYNTVQCYMGWLAAVAGSAKKTK